jgi:dolichol-phosphate mannosyltransferase
MGAHLHESLSIVLAAYREGENLAYLLPSIRKVVDDMTVPYELIVVDTQEAMDNTEGICHANQARHVRRRGGNDYGDAIRTGISEAKGEYVVIMDADGSHNAEFIRDLWEHRHVADIVIASRYVPGGHTDNPWLLVRLSRFLNLFFRAIAGLPVLDVSNSFRLYRGDLLRSLHLTYRHFDVLEEILGKLLWLHGPSVRVLEVPFRFGRRIRGESKRTLLVFAYHFLLAALRLSRMRRRVVRGMVGEQTL